MKEKTGNSKLAKIVNTSLILNIIRDKKEISRARIAKLSKLNPSTISNITRELIQMGILIEVGSGTSLMGRKPINISLNPTGPCVIGVEINEDKIVAIMTNLEIEVLTEARTSINNTFKENEIIKNIIDCINQVINKSKKDKKDIKGIGLAITGLIDAKAGIINFSPNIGLKNLPIKKLIEEEFDIPIYIDNDVKALALGEYRFGSGKGIRDLVCIKIEKGLGFGIIIDGRIHRGVNWVAGEIGHNVIDLNGPRCQCGNRGCLVVFTGGRAMVSHVMAAIGENKKTLITQLAQNENEKITPEMIFMAASKNDELAKNIIEDAGRYLGISIAYVINSFDPEMIILTGKIPRLDNFNLMLEPAKKEAPKHIFGGAIRKTKIVITKLGDNSTALGGATLALEELFNPLNL